MNNIIKSWRELSLSIKIIIVLLIVAILFGRLIIGNVKVEVVDIIPISTFDGNKEYITNIKWSSADKIAVGRWKKFRNLGSDIWIMSTDGSYLTQLTQDGDVASFDWSPDGEKIIFSSYRNRMSKLWILEVERDNLSQLIEISNHVGGLAWSPDGRKIAYDISIPKDEHGRAYDTHVWVMNADGTEQRQLIPMASSSPSWSPDGRRIAFTSEEGLYISNSDGTEIRRISRQGGGSPSWSPDGELIAYTTSLGFGNPGQIEVRKAEGRGRKWLTSANIDVIRFSWSPNENKIAFVKYEDIGWGEDVYNICIMTLGR